MTQIIGYRKDRLGARIIALGNLLRLEKKFAAQVKYLWPDAFEGHDMAIENDTHPIFDTAFQIRYLQQVSEGSRPDEIGVTDIDAIRARVTTADFAKRLKTGERFLCNEGLHPTVFADEVASEQMSMFRHALSQIAWSPRVQEVLEQASKKIINLSIQPIALHVRRGDVLDKEPWCHKNWTSKFAPDEFYYAVMDRPETAVIVFSDTPEVAARMAATYKNALTLESLVDAPDLSEMQRDLIELLLMSRCREIVAPSLSAFSSSAAMLGGMHVTEIPYKLPAKERFKSYNVLLDRILSRPDSFYNKGDFAQSLGYAFKHALNIKKHKELYSLIKCEINKNKNKNFSFYKPIAMALAISCNDNCYAVKLEKEYDPNIWPDDFLISSALGCIARHVSCNSEKATSDFLEIYLSRHKTDPDQDSLANYFFSTEPIFKYIFQVDDLIHKTMSYGSKKKRIFLFPHDSSILGGSLNSAFPIWIPGYDWPEMFEKKQIIKNTVNNPDYKSKTKYIPDEIKKYERDSFSGRRPLPNEEELLKLLSLYSIILLRSGHYARAAALMLHCCNQMPNEPIFLKRLANLLIEKKDFKRAAYNLEKASEILPDHPGIALARANLYQYEGDYHSAANLMENISQKNNIPFNIFKSWELSLRKLGFSDERKIVIEKAENLFPNNQIFRKQWSRT